MDSFGDKNQVWTDCGMRAQLQGSASMYKRMQSKDGTNSVDVEDGSGKSLILNHICSA